MNEQATPSKPNISPENMTQPMGPLEEGDQALADAINRMPEGEHVVEETGTKLTVTKEEAPDEVFGGRKASVSVHEFTGNDNDYEVKGVSGSIAMRDAPEVDRLTPSATVSDSKINPDWTMAHETATVFGNQIGKMPILKPDRARAQAAKLDVARQIDEARERVEQSGSDKAA